ncbi:MAG: hypothetical protein H7Z43_15960 [Clostridia bacterium]|nr:hypothetical protein [Deltaproteobacteria bacterium]
MGIEPASRRFTNFQGPITDGEVIPVPLSGLMMDALQWGRREISVALGTAVMRAGAAWSRHPGLVAVGAVAAGVGILASGGGQLWSVLSAPVGLAFAMVNLKTDNSVSRRFTVDGAVFANEALIEDTKARIETIERAKMRGDIPVPQDIWRVVANSKRSRRAMMYIAEAKRGPNPEYAAEIVEALKPTERNISEL